VGEKVKEDEMDGASSINGRDEKCVQNFDRKTWREDIGVDWKIILEWILEKWCGKLWTGYIWIRVRTSGELLWTR